MAADSQKSQTQKGHTTLIAIKKCCPVCGAAGTENFCEECGQALGPPPTISKELENVEAAATQTNFSGMHFDIKSLEENIASRKANFLKAETADLKKFEWFKGCWRGKFSSKVITVNVWHQDILNWVEGGQIFQRHLITKGQAWAKSHQRIVAMTADTITTQTCRIIGPVELKIAEGVMAEFGIPLNHEHTYTYLPKSDELVLDDMTYIRDN